MSYPQTVYYRFKKDNGYYCAVLCTLIHTVTHTHTGEPNLWIGFNWVPPLYILFNFLNKKITAYNNSFSVLSNGKKSPYKKKLEFNLETGLHKHILNFSFCNWWDVQLLEMVNRGLAVSEPKTNKQVQFGCFDVLFKICFVVAFNKEFSFNLPQFSKKNSAWFVLRIEWQKRKTLKNARNNFNHSWLNSIRLNYFEMCVNGFQMTLKDREKSENSRTLRKFQRNTYLCQWF